jgi:hypothetical protein
MDGNWHCFGFLCLKSLLLGVHSSVYVFAAGMEELRARVPPHWLASVFSQHTRGEGVEHLRTYLPSCACTVRMYV